MPTTFSGLVGLLIEIITSLVPLIFALTVIYITWKVVDAWVLRAGDQAALAEGKQVALVGVIALVFMVGIWGFLRFLQASLGLV